MHSNHNSIIKHVANSILRPKGFFQMGKSRTWLYDCGYCVVQIEFQPSSFSRGTYCNVGTAFLFEYFGELNKTLAFDFGTRRISSGKSEFIEYTGDDKAFEAQLFELTNNALEYAKELIKFKSLKHGDWRMSKLLFSKWINRLFSKHNYELYDCYNAAMIKFLRGKPNSGKRLLTKLNRLNLQSPYKEWIETTYAEFCGTETTAESAKAKVRHAINARRCQTKIDQFKHRTTNSVSTPSTATYHSATNGHLKNFHC